MKYDSGEHPATVVFWLMERMKLTYLLLLLTFTGISVRANQIDALKTFDDVNKFAREHVFEGNSQTLILDPKKASKSECGKDSFHKVDLDNDGLTDLVVDGLYLVAVRDEGRGKYGVHMIDRGSFALIKYSLANISYEGKTPLLLVRRYDPEREADSAAAPGSIVSPSMTGDAAEKTLIFKFGGFIEYNTGPDDLKIEEIDLSTSGCFGSCPIFKLSVFRNRSATYNSIQYSGNAGRFRTTIDQRSFNDLVNTINYMGLTKLKDEYAVGWTDDQGATLRIKYNNGKIKKISDYGMIGTFGLENLYNQILNLRNTQNWVR